MGTEPAHLSNQTSSNVIRYLQVGGAALGAIYTVFGLIRLVGWYQFYFRGTGDRTDVESVLFLAVGLVPLAMELWLLIEAGSSLFSNDDLIRKSRLTQLKALIIVNLPLLAFWILKTGT